VGFLGETLDALGVADERGSDDLDGNVTTEARVPRAVHFPHASGAERREDLVGTEGRAGL
jgi:hypothetical protein